MEGGHMKKLTQLGKRLLFAAFILQSLTGCASRDEAPSETPAVIEQEDQLATAESELKAGEAQLSELDSAAPLPVLPISNETTAQQLEPAKKAPPIPDSPVLNSKIRSKVEPKAEAKTSVKAADKNADKKSAKNKKSSEAADEKSDNGGFKTTKKACDMKSKPSAKSATLTTLPKGRKIWADKQGGFYKVSRVKGVGYLAASCF